MTETLVPVGTRIDLTNCDREPIRVPGSVQPHGVLLALTGAARRVAQVSANCSDVFGRGPEEILGAGLDSLFDADSVQLLADTMTNRDLPATGSSAPLQIRTAPSAAGVVPRDLDCLVHRSGDNWIVEVEPLAGEVSLANTYHQVRQAVAELNRATTSGELAETAVQHIRRLTGFDRVMLYRFDRDWSGEVCAESKREELESFRGLHYPAGDIPAQARALYTVNWLRFIRDIDAVNAPLVPQLQPASGEPLDLSFAALRSVSPIHCEYLRNMGVRASMSISLVVGGKLAGLIACHHYSGPYVPTAGVRATCEFLAQTLSMLVSSVEQRERESRVAEVSQALARVVQRTAAKEAPVVEVLHDEADLLLSMFDAGGMAWTLDGRTRTAGSTPAPDGVRRLRSVLRRRSEDGESVVAVEALAQAEPDLLDLREVASGALLLPISADQDVVFFRPEVTKTVDWAGNPHLKELATGPDGVARLSPRGSFALWRETVEGRSATWEDVELTHAVALRDHLVLQMFHEARELLDIAETLQRSLLPDVLPTPAGWALAADYRPASAGVGGDWYDAVPLPDDRLLLVVGDVAGHGLQAAGAMAQIRNALRGYAVEDPSPARILARLDHLTSTLMETSMATAVLALLDPATGQVTLSAAGHPPPLVLRAGTAALVGLEPLPPLGAGALSALSEAQVVEARLDPGDALLLFSDGVFERREEAIDVSLGRWVEFASAGLTGTPDPSVMMANLLTGARPSSGEDDATLLLLVRT